MRDKHGIPDPLTLRVRTGYIVSEQGIIEAEFQHSPVISRDPKGAAMQWVMPPVDSDPYPADGREYLECVFAWHVGSRWVLPERMTRNRSRPTGYAPYCLDCERKRKQLARLRARGCR